MHNKNPAIAGLFRTYRIPKYIAVLSRFYQLNNFPLSSLYHFGEIRTIP